MKHKFSKLFWVGIGFIILGFTSLGAEQVFYNTIDQNGILHESLFLPLGVISILTGILLMICLVLKRLFVLFYPPK